MKKVALVVFAVIVLGIATTQSAHAEGSVFQNMADAISTWAWPSSN